MKKNSNSLTNNDRTNKPGKARGPVQRDAKEVMAELVVKLSQKLESQAARTSEEKRRQQDMPGPNRDRLTVGVDLGDKWSNYLHCGFGRGETDGGRAANSTTGLCGILPVVGRGASGHGSGDALGMGAGCGGKLRS